MQHAKRMIRRLSYSVAIAFPMFTIPQVIKLYTTQEAGALSLLT